MAKVVNVIIDNGWNNKVYRFKTGIETLEAGDKLVVDTANGLVIGTVKDYVEDYAKATKWVIQKIDLTEHEERVERSRRIKEVKRQLTLRRKEIEEQEVMKLLAAKDESFAKLLNELNQLQEKGEA